MANGILGYSHFFVVVVFEVVQHFVRKGTGSCIVVEAVLELSERHHNPSILAANGPHVILPEGDIDKESEYEG